MSKVTLTAAMMSKLLDLAKTYVKLRLGSIGCEAQSTEKTSISLEDCHPGQTPPGTRFVVRFMASPADETEA